VAWCGGINIEHIVYNIIIENRFNHLKEGREVASGRPEVHRKLFFEAEVHRNFKIQLEAVLMWGGGGRVVMYSNRMLKISSHAHMDKGTPRWLFFLSQEC